MAFTGLNYLPIHQFISLRYFYIFVIMNTISSKLIFNEELLSITIDRLCFQLIENHNDFASSVLVGIQPRGVILAKRIFERIREISPDSSLQYGELDISFFRDDFRRREMIVPSSTRMDMSLEGKRVILVDDVLHTGRTVRAALDALLVYGRPAGVELLVLIDRKFSRQLPIYPHYIGKSIDAIAEERVKVSLGGEDGDHGVWLISGKAGHE